MDFDILIDQSLSTLFDEQINKINPNFNLLSMINDFEDGIWRHKKFHRFIWDNILETALSSQERDAYIGDAGTLLAQAAQNLRLTDSAGDISKGSELAEIFLYGIMRRHFRALPVVPKIFYKQNSQDNAKGADSVHIVITDDERFTLWFGEAKFYNSIEDNRFDSIIKSVNNSIATEKLRKENSIITNAKDLGDLVKNEKMKSEIMNSLSSRNSIDGIKPLLNIPIFILHECPITESATYLSPEYRTSIIELHKERAQSFFEKHQAKTQGIHNYDKIKFHLILFPIPNKEKIINKFVKSVHFHKES